MQVGGSESEVGGKTEEKGIELLIPIHLGHKFYMESPLTWKIQPNTFQEARRLANLCLKPKLQDLVKWKFYLPFRMI